MNKPTDQPNASGTVHEHDSPEEESSCLQWRCRSCGTVCLGTLADKPQRCGSCGKSDFEFTSED